MSKLNDACAHKWASRQKKSGKGQNMHFEGDTIYSYGWWPMAKWHEAVDGTPYVIMAEKAYSGYTARHMGSVRKALPNDVRVFYSNEYDVSYYSSRRTPSLTPISALRTMLLEATNYYNDFFNKKTYMSHRSYNPDIRREASARLHRKAALLCEMAGLPWDENFDKYLISQSETDMMNRILAPMMDARMERERIKAEKELVIENALHAAMSKYLVDPIEAAKRWMRGEYKRDDHYVELPDDDEYVVLTRKKRIYQEMETAMRIVGDNVVTNHNAYVPVREAKILWERMKAGKPVHGERVGLYTVTGWNGELVIGCHHIPREIVEYFVELYNW